MERVSLFVDVYNFLACSSSYLKQNAFLDFTKFPEYFIDSKTQVFTKMYLYGGKSLGNMLLKLEKSSPRIDVIPGEINQNGDEKGTDVNLAVGMVTKAFHNTYDVAVLFSADSDYVKVVRQLRRMGKNILVAVPDGKPLQEAQKIIQAADGSIVLKEDFYDKYWLDTKRPYQSLLNPQQSTNP